jgi:hypothetical protein
MQIPERIDRLIDAGVHRAAGLSAPGFHRLADGLAGSGVVCVHPSLVAASALAPLLALAGRPGFVVTDMTDLDAFTPIVEVTVPDRPLYLAEDVDRGDDLLGWKPNAALPELLARGRTPLTIGEGISWLLQEPDRLQANNCFMCAGSRKPKGTGADARVPAVWISRGTGRDGADHRGAPKVGWCWAGNHHDWLGFASAGIRA